jgi:hypothetical protein
MRIALANSAQEFAGFLGPLIGGLIAVLAGKVVHFSVAIPLQLIAIAMVMTHVDEPRHRELW